MGKIESVDYFYSSVEKKKILGCSMIRVNYYKNSIKYSILFDIHGKKAESKKI